MIDTIYLLLLLLLPVIIFFTRYTLIVISSDKFVIYESHNGRSQTVLTNTITFIDSKKGRLKEIDWSYYDSSKKETTKWKRTRIPFRFFVCVPMQARRCDGNYIEALPMIYIRLVNVLHAVNTYPNLIADVIQFTRTLISEEMTKPPSINQAAYREYYSTRSDCVEYGKDKGIELDISIIYGIPDKYL
jgi:hypothetical protein